MKEEIIFKYLPFLENVTRYDTDQVKEFEDNLKVVGTRFTLPSFLESIDWLPKYEREESNTQIDYILVKDKLPLAWWSYKEDLILVFFDYELSLYYEALYHYYKSGFSVQVVMIFREGVKAAHD